jgi:phenylalanyl-tRNA synthetase beta chain
LFYEAKGSIEQALSDLNLANVTIGAATPEALPAWAHPGRAAVISQGETELGVIFELHPKVAADWDLPGTLAVGVLYLPDLLQAKRAKQAFQAPPTYPQAPFDISLLVPAREPVAKVEQAIRQAERKMIRDVTLFDIYEGKSLPEGQKSVSYTVTFGASDHTLSPEEIQKLQERMIKSMEARGYSARV